MIREIINFISPAVEADFSARKGLSSYVRQMRRRNKGASRWLALAVLTGAGVALAFIRFLVR